MKNRVIIVSIIFIVTALIFTVKLFFLQVVDTEYKLSADNNTLRYVTQYPSRGIVFDRTGKILVSNKIYYDLKFVHKTLQKFDTLAFCGLIDISKDEFTKIFEDSKNSIHPVIIKNQITPEEFAYIEEQLYKYPGFYSEKRTLREYAKPIGAHVLGYVGEVNIDELKDDPYYKPGDYKGKSGIELIYEKYLRGRKGVEIYNVNVHGKIQSRYKEGKYDTTAVAGYDIVSTIDSELQAYGELLMKNKIGGIVAIEPATGEILALISSPTYDPNLFTGKKLADNYKSVEKSEGKPLFNRALRSMQPPGSPFKLVNALIGLENKLINDQTVFVTAGYDAGSHIVKDHISGAISFEKSIQFSSNAYYCHVYKKIISDVRFQSYADAYDNWKVYVQSFGLGVNLGTDLDFEKQGILYSSSYYDRYYGKKRWNYNTIISLAFGQGELGFTPLQTANMTSAIANRGFFYTPHIVKEIKGFEIDRKFKTKHFTKVSESYFEPVVNAMELVVSAGTGISAYFPGIQICGKTGTAQNPHGEDHSIFVAFAPKDNPKIAISVLIENAGFGATWAAPIASLMIEKYLNRTISRPWLEEYIINKSFINNKGGVQIENN